MNIKIQIRTLRTLNVWTSNFSNITFWSKIELWTCWTSQKTEQFMNTKLYVPRLVSGHITTGSNFEHFWTSHFGPKPNFKHVDVEHHKKLNSLQHQTVHSKTTWLKVRENKGCSLPYFTSCRNNVFGNNLCWH